MISFLFWNLHGAGLDQAPKSLREHIVRLSVSRAVDIFLFAESPYSTPEMTALLNSAERGHFRECPTDSNRIAFFSRFANQSCFPRHDSADGRLSVRRLLLSKGELLLASLHGASKLHHSATSQALQFAEYGEQIRRIELTDGHQQTIVIGDFNQDPFEAGMLGAAAFHAVPTEEIAIGESRTVAGVDYPFFYNPMWSCFGDRSEGPSGSYYYRTSSHDCQFWHTYDQLLVRPGIMRQLKHVEILDHDGTKPLVDDRGIPNSVSASDHLPIFFQLDLAIWENQR